MMQFNSEDRVLISSRALKRLGGASPDIALSVLDGLPGMIAVWNRDLCNVVANKAYVEWFGRSPEEMVGMHIREVLGEDVYTLNHPFMLQALAGKEQLFDRTLVDQQGDTRHTQASYIPHRNDETGEIDGFLVLVTDVTARVAAEVRARLSVEQYRALAASVPDSFVMLFDRDLRYSIAEGEALDAFGYSSVDLEGRTIYEALPRWLAVELEPRYLAALAGERSEWERVRGDKIYRLVSAPVSDRDGEIFAGMAIAQDITYRRRTDAINAALGEISNAVARQATTESISDLIATNLREIFQSDTAAVVHFIDRDYARIISMSPSRPENIPDELHWRGRESSVTAQVARTGRPALALYTEPKDSYVAAMQADGLVAGAAAPIYHDGELWGAITLNSKDANRLNEGSLQELAKFADLLQVALENFKAWSTLLDQALADPLTGLINRRGLDLKLEKQFKIELRPGQSISIVTIDLDHFKQINDDFGHHAGDRVLRELAALMTSIIRANELVARIGGEEFLWILPDTSTQQAFCAAERLRVAIEGHDFGLSRPVTASIGISTTTQVRNLPDVIIQSDQALYEAKRSGRNRVVVLGAAQGE